MKLDKIAPLALSGVLLAGVFATASLAQQSAPTAAPAASEARRDGEWRRPDPAAMAARRAEHLRAALQLRPNQEGALQAYLAARKQQQRPDRKAMAQMTTPERLDARRAMMTQRLAAFDQRAAATKAFYAQLDLAQQKAFDAIGPRADGRHGKGHGEHGRRG